MFEDVGRYFSLRSWRLDAISFKAAVFPRRYAQLSGETEPVLGCFSKKPFSRPDLSARRRSLVFVQKSDFIDYRRQPVLFHGLPRPS